jgi:tetratricopeptide (TPR) repeat protein
MEGESEYSFWHLLVRDVAYGQIARAERALGLDTAQAEARLARALGLTPADDPERPELALRWADAALQAGRPREAAAASEEALAAFSARGETEAAARALILLARVTSKLGEGRQIALASEAVGLLEAEPGPALVEAFTQLAAGHFLVGAHDEAIAAAERALALTERLGLPAPAHALGFAGIARAYRGDPDGLAETERALALLLEQGAGHYAAALQNNLAIARYPLQGPARALVAFEQGIAFCEQRGLADMAAVLESDCPGLLVELGRPEQALERAGRLAAALEASGSTHVLIWVRAFELATHLARGESEAAPGIADWLVETVRSTGAADVTVEVLAAAAAARLATGAPEQARALLAELEQTPGVRQTPYYSRQLAAMLRTALAAGDTELAERLAEGLEPLFPLREHALCAARAELAEHAGDHTEAANLYAEAAARWQEFGNVPERAYALLGQGRCLLALGRPGAEVPLAEARELFKSIGYKPPLAETDALLARTAAARYRRRAHSVTALSCGYAGPAGRSQAVGGGPSRF